MEPGNNQLMNKLILPIFLISFAVVLPFNNYGQYLSNPSFEGIPTKDFPPSGWEPCDSKSTPDTQPGVWEVQNDPSDGSTFIGMVTRGPLGPNANTWEDCQAKLNEPLEKDQCYIMHVDLALSPSSGHTSFSYGWISYANPVILRIWCGDNLCNKSEILWESNPIDHTEWKTCDFITNPRLSDCNFLILEVYYYSFPEYFGHMLIDNIHIEKTIDKVVSLDTVVKEGDQIMLNASIGDLYEWFPDINISCSDCQNPTVGIEKSISYSVKVIDSSTGCSITEIFNLWTKSKVFAPNAFSPNGDGINDIFEPIYNTNVIDPTLRVYNRWGELVFTSQGTTCGWDGKYNGSILPASVYVWTLEYQYYDTEGYKTTIQTGSVTLIR